MTLDRLPLTVIAGYLGAGKTTLINRLLSENHGLRLMVMVNDFGAINIDAGLLAAAEGDTLTLTNGCVCCTMGADLFMALGDALDRRPRPDHLIIEASGIAEPGRIANAAVAEPEMSYGGIVTLVDGVNFARQAGDAQIGAQLREQVARADMVLVTKCDTVPEKLRERLSEITRAPVRAARDVESLAGFLFAPDLRLPPGPGGGRHPAYVSWSARDDTRLERAALARLLARRPAGIYRLKGFVACDETTSWAVQVVGAQVEILPAPPRTGSEIVAIGLASGLDPDAVEHWWRTAPDE